MKDEEINLVVVNTPKDSHLEYTMLALKNGKNVLCEKPFMTSSKDAEKVFKYAKEKKLVVMANQNRRFDGDMRTVRKVIESGVLGQIIEIESHYDYYRPSVKEKRGFTFLQGLGVHTLDQIVGLFGIPKKVVYDCRSIDNPGITDDYFDIDLFFSSPLKAIVKTSYYVKINYPSFTIHGRKGSFIIPAAEHQSNTKKKEGPVEVCFDPISEEKWGTLSYINENGEEIVKLA